jgi:hypothetical protein
MPLVTSIRLPQTFSGLTTQFIRESKLHAQYYPHIGGPRNGDRPIQLPFNKIADNLTWLATQDTNWISLYTALTEPVTPGVPYPAKRTGLNNVSCKFDAMLSPFTSHVSFRVSACVTKAAISIQNLSFKSSFTSHSTFTQIDPTPDILQWYNFEGYPPTSAPEDFRSSLRVRDANTDTWETQEVEIIVPLNVVVFDIQYRVMPAQSPLTFTI